MMRMNDDYADYDDGDDDNVLFLSAQQTSRGTLGVRSFLTCKHAFRQSSMHVFLMLSSKSPLKLSMLLRFWLANVFFATARCTFCRPFSQVTSEPARFTSLPFRASRSTKRWKTVTHLWFSLWSEWLTTSTFHKSDVWLPNFLQLSKQYSLMMGSSYKVQINHLLSCHNRLKIVPIRAFCLVNCFSALSSCCLCKLQSQVQNQLCILTINSCAVSILVESCCGCLSPHSRWFILIYDI